MDRSTLESQTMPHDEQRYLCTKLALFYWARLKVSDIMNRDVVTLRPDQSVQEAAMVMAKKRISCLLICSDNQPVGVLSQKDLLASAQTNGTPTTIRIGDKMSQPVKTVEPQTPVLYASMIMKDRGIKHLPVVSEGKLMGIVTQTDLVRALESMSALRSVTEIMTKDMATVAPDQSVAQAVDTMVQRGISCVLVMRHGKAEGILTEKDVLHAVLAQGKDPLQVYVVDVMSYPLITITPSHSVLSASRLMDEKQLHRLVVADENSTLGIVTRTDIINSYQTYAQRETQQELHMLTHATDAIILLDTAGKTTYVNPAFLQMFGADSPGLFIDQPFPPDELWVDPQDKFDLIAEQNMDLGGIQKLFLRKVNGKYLSINLCLNDVKDVEGNIIGRQGVAWDLSRDAV